MDEFTSHLRHITRITFLILAINLMMWLFWLDLRMYFAGFILGTSVSLLNAHYTAWKIRQLADVALQPDSEAAKKRVNLGFITRASTSLLAVIIAMKADDIAFSTTFSGLFLTQLISFCVGIYVQISNKGGR